jgi:tRNA threonylcarbamoyladenosine biosynthesis protein TsaE
VKTHIITHSATETAEVGKRLGNKLNKKCVVAFLGGLGAGKTCFTSGLARGLGFEGDVTSPTFAIINEYVGGILKIYHFDMYRIADEDELDSIGFYVYLDEEAVLIIEWSENIRSALPEDTIFVSIEGMGDENRSISISASEEILKEF